MSNADKREDGYYWVVVWEGDAPEVAKYTFIDQWERAGHPERMYDSELHYINETMIPWPESEVK